MPSSHFYSGRFLGKGYMSQPKNEAVEKLLGVSSDLGIAFRRERFGRVLVGNAYAFAKSVFKSMANLFRLNFVEDAW